MKTLSLKLDDDIAQDLNDECYLYEHERNRYINEAVREKLQRDEEKRREEDELLYGKVFDDERNEDFEKYILPRLTEENKRFLRHMYAQMGYSLFDAISLGLHKLKEDYEKRPFNYLPMG